MKWVLLFAFLLLIPLTAAQVPILEFNISKSPGGILPKVPRTLLVDENLLFSSENNSLIINIKELVPLVFSNVSYSTNNPKNINILFKEDKVYVTPKPSWFGEELVIIYAAGLDESALSQVKILRQENLLYNELNLPYLENNVFEGILFNMFEQEFAKIKNERSQIQGKTDIVAFIEDQQLLVELNDDVIITTGFVPASESLKKPEIKIKVASELLELSPSIAHCSDSIINEGETNIDCGGECQPCKSEKFSLSFLIFGFIAVALILLAYSNRFAIVDVITSIVQKDHHKIKPNIRKLTFKSLEDLKMKIPNQSEQNSLIDLEDIIKNYFKSILAIGHELTYDEIIQNLKSRRISKPFVNNIEAMLAFVTQISYSDHQLTRQEITKAILQLQKIVGGLPLKLRQKS